MLGYDVVGRLLFKLPGKIKSHQNGKPGKPFVAAEFVIVCAIVAFFFHK